MNKRIVALSLLAGCGGGNLEEVQVFDPEPRLMPKTVEVGAEAVYDWVPGQTAIAQLLDHGTQLRAKYRLQGAVELSKPIPVVCDTLTHCEPMDCVAMESGFSCSRGCPAFVDYVFSEAVVVTGGMVNPRPRAYVDSHTLRCAYELTGDVVLADDTPVQ